MSQMKYRKPSLPSYHDITSSLQNVTTARVQRELVVIPPFLTAAHSAKPAFLTVDCEPDSKKYRMSERMKHTPNKESPH